MNVVLWFLMGFFNRQAVTPTIGSIVITDIPYKNATLSNAIKNNVSLSDTLFNRISISNTLANNIQVNGQ